jgi:hypothetical protein
MNLYLVTSEDGEHWTESADTAELNRHSWGTCSAWMVVEGDTLGDALREAAMYRVSPDKNQLLPALRCVGIASAR